MAVMVELLCPEIVRNGVTVQKSYTQKFMLRHAEIILKKGRWKLPLNSPWVFKDQSLIKKAKKPKDQNTK